MKKRKITLKRWVQNFLLIVLFSYIAFISCTIESIGNSTYNLILIVFTILSLASLYLLKNFSSVLDD